jgi:arsenite-transporting ATPase
MRILLFSGKGGVGKTSIAAATGLQLSRLGYRTLVMSVDPAHSLADSFDIDAGLFHGQTSDPYRIDERLSIHEVNIQKEIKRHWREISSYVVSVLRTTGISDVEAEELAILPGMEELSAMMYVNQFRREQRYDVIVLDCAPTAESMRFVSMPTTLEWYMKHIFPFQRGFMKAVRPIANRVAPVELHQALLLQLAQAVDGDGLPSAGESSPGAERIEGGGGHGRALSVGLRASFVVRVAR